MVECCTNRSAAGLASMGHVFPWKRFAYLVASHFDVDLASIAFTNDLRYLDVA